MELLPSQIVLHGVTEFGSLLAEFVWFNWSVGEFKYGCVGELECG